MQLSSCHHQRLASANRGHRSAANWPACRHVWQRRTATQVEASVVWRQLDETKAWVVHARTARRPRAVLHFLGGAFAGAAPQVAYHLKLELLAEAGFTVVATPYRLTFKHLDCARRVASDFDGALRELRGRGRSYLAPPGTPVVGVGHSNGALLHLLIGSIGAGSSCANVLISYNNKQVSDAVPIPGLLDGLRPTVNAARAASPPPGSPPPAGGPFPSAAALLASAAAALPPGVAVERRLVEAATPAVEQLGSVLDEVGDGTTEFTPTPAESRSIISGGYAVPRSLLVQFEDDTIDETPEMAELLLAAAAEGSRPGPEGEVGGSSGSPRADGGWDAAALGTWGSSGGGGSSSSLGSFGSDEEWAGGRGYAFGDGAPQRGILEVRQLLLPGSHITPCGADWDAGPWSAALGRARAESQEDVRRLVGEVAAWVKAAVKEERRRLRGGLSSSGSSADPSPMGTVVADSDEAPAVAGGAARERAAVVVVASAQP